MKILIDYWYVIFAILALLTIAAVAVARFFRQAEAPAGLRRLPDQIPLACPRYPLRAIFWPGR